MVQLSRRRTRTHDTRQTQAETGKKPSSATSKEAAGTQQEDRPEENSAELEIEAIMDAKRTRGKKMYLVKWANGMPPTWEPAENFTPSTLVKYQVGQTNEQPEDEAEIVDIVGDEENTTKRQRKSKPQHRKEIAQRKTRTRARDARPTASSPSNSDESDSGEVEEEPAPKAKGAATAGKKAAAAARGGRRMRSTPSRPSRDDGETTDEQSAHSEAADPPLRKRRATRSSATVQKRGKEAKKSAKKKPAVPSTSAKSEKQAKEKEEEAHGRNENNEQNEEGQAVAQGEETGEKKEPEEFVVEAIVDARRNGDSFEYKVRWKEYESDDDTWEPRSGIEHLSIFKKFERTKMPKILKRLKEMEEAEEEESKKSSKVSSKQNREKSDQGVRKSGRPKRKAAQSEPKYEPRHTPKKRDTRRPKQDVQTSNADAIFEAFTRERQEKLAEKERKDEELSELTYKIFADPGLTAVEKIRELVCIGAPAAAIQRLYDQIDEQSAVKSFFV